MLGNEFRFSRLLLVLVFLGFYGTIEYLFWAQAVQLNYLGIIAEILISFLNLIPAGILAFTIVSLLPKSLGFNLEEELLKSTTKVGNPKVAVLYTSYNDFMIAPATFDIGEARNAGMTFYILDDSTDPIKKSEVDAFAKCFNCEVIRRSSRIGYKAGAINEWIRYAGTDYEYFFILDSDSQVSASTLRYCADLACRDTSIAIVQSKTLTMTSNPTRLTRSSVTIQHAYMEIVQRAMRNLGTSPYYGHNALIKTSALLSVGGFVEESNEDYKTLSLLHSKGYSSIYAEKAVSWEEVPPDYISARKRSLRWSRDAVSQLNLVRSGTPLAIAFFLFYGWITYMSNAVLIAFLPLMAWATIPHLFGGGLIEVAGTSTLGVIILWPIVALRIKDSELTPLNMGKALFWGSVYNIPMMGPIALQILKTTVLKIWEKCKALSGLDEQFVKEFVVTPKNKESGSVLFFASRMKCEIFVGLALIVVSILSGHLWAMIFSCPQILSALFLPLLARTEAKDKVVEQRSPVPIAPIYRRSYSSRAGTSLIGPNTLQLNALQIEMRCR